MHVLLKIFELQNHRQVVLRTIWSSLLVSLITVVIARTLWQAIYPAAINPIVREITIMTFNLTLLISIPVLYGFFFMALQVWRKNHELLQLANLDPLTGLHNRRSLAENFAMLSRKARRNNQTGTLLLIDVDKFKAINDKHGHEVGDHVLIHLANNLRVLAGPDSCVARLGGEEFSVTCFGLNEQDAFGFAEKIRMGIQNTQLENNAARISYTVSIGYCLIQNQDSLNDALRNADAALYTAKRTGRNKTVMFDLNAAPLAPKAEDLLHIAEKTLSSQVASSN
jgi:diguanylate cyclase (GGDEF)-like protein